MNVHTLKSNAKEHDTSDPRCVKSHPKLFLCLRDEARLSGLPHCNTWVLQNADISLGISSWWCLGESLEEHSDPSGLDEPLEQQLQEPEGSLVQWVWKTLVQMARLLVACVVIALAALAEIGP